jgi:hypothetical protein
MVVLWFLCYKEKVWYGHHQVLLIELCFGVILLLQGEKPLGLVQTSWKAMLGPTSVRVQILT